MRCCSRPRQSKNNQEDSATPAARLLQVSDAIVVRKMLHHSWWYVSLGVYWMFEFALCAHGGSRDWGRSVIWDRNVLLKMFIVQYFLVCTLQLWLRVVCLMVWNLVLLVLMSEWLQVRHHLHNLPLGCVKGVRVKPKHWVVVREKCFFKKNPKCQVKLRCWHRVREGSKDPS